MFDMALAHSGIYSLFVFPFLIFLSRICDVSIGTLRIIFVSKGFKYFAPFLGFFEVLIWLLAISQIMQNLSNIWCYIAYGGGFAAGTFVGMYIEEKLSLGTVVIRIVMRKNVPAVKKYLEENSINITSTECESSDGRVILLNAIIKRTSVKDISKILEKFSPQSFYSVEDVKFFSAEVSCSKKFSFTPGKAGNL
ncbi:MAG: hypothetical protein DKM50_13840 [Candidatus Margulisiibacteriota bacterium]|nr:MAG: hypothetical protein DKM50_13840 [Candidatus Margulisiibacteriota bacterium]HCY35598.1 hypothetical protein [Candidatus Margulisiibacteriota bacterium]